MCSVLVWAELCTSVYSPSILTGWPPRRPRPSPGPLTAVQYCIGIVWYWWGRVHPPPTHSTLPRASQWLSNIALWCYKVLVSHFIEYKISEWPSLVRSMVSKWSADKILVPGPCLSYSLFLFSYQHWYLESYYYPRDSDILISTYLTPPVRPSRYLRYLRLYQDECSCCCAAEEFSCRVNAGRWTDINTAAAATMTLNRESGEW